MQKLAMGHDQQSSVAASQARGKKVYDHYCKICHGAGGQGDGFNSAMLDPPPRNFADEAFWKRVNDEQLQTVISQGGESVGKSVLMPAWGRTLEASQITDVIAFLRTVPALAKKAAAAEESEN